MTKPLRLGRRGAAAGVVAAVLFLHSLLLALLPRLPGVGGHGEWRRPVQVRQIAQPSAGNTGPTAQATLARAAMTNPPVRPAPATAADQAVRVAAPMPAAAAATMAPAPAASGGERAQASLAEPGGVGVPVYATRLPAAVTLHYRLRRGNVSGQAEMRWQPEGTRYELTLRGQSGGAPLLASTSVGLLDANGLAPERQTESRRGRELRAVNFQRDSARITFSGPQLEYRLLPGAQDRLSWMLQLAGVLAADARLAEAGRQVQLFVSGPRGDAAVWVFEVVGRESVDLPAGPVQGAVHLQREARRLYDTQVDVWLDPARQHLPVRARLLVRPTGEGTEFLLESVAVP